MSSKRAFCENRCSGIHNLLRGLNECVPAISAFFAPFIIKFVIEIPKYFLSVTDFFFSKICTLQAILNLSSGMYFCPISHMFVPILIQFGTGDYHGPALSGHGFREIDAIKTLPTDFI